MVISPNVSICISNFKISYFDGIIIYLIPCVDTKLPILRTKNSSSHQKRISFHARRAMTNVKEIYLASLTTHDYVHRSYERRIEKCKVFKFLAYLTYDVHCTSFRARQIPDSLFRALQTSLAAFSTDLPKQHPIPCSPYLL